MPDPILNKLGAYLDGELNQQDTAAVEAHLKTCAECRHELEDLQQLSGLLRAVPQPEFTPAPDFKAQIMLQMPRRDETQNHPAGESFLIWLVPTMVVVGLIFIQVTMNLSTLVSLANQAGLLDGAASWASTAPQQVIWVSAVQTAAGNLLDLPGLPGLAVLNDAGVFTWNAFITLLLQVGAAAIYWGVLIYVWRNKGYTLSLN
jgi:anti-sigma factor RsiW